MVFFTSREEELTFTVINGTRIRNFLKGLGFSTRFVREVTYGGLVFVNGKVSTTNEELRPGDKIRILFPKEEPGFYGGKIPEIFYEDRDYLVVKKDRGVATHPAPGSGVTLCHGVGEYYLRQGIRRKLRPVTRLDRETSGLVLFAKHSAAQEYLQRRQGTAEFRKEYYAVVTGSLEKNTGVIDFPMTWDPKLRVSIPGEGKEARTEYQVLFREKNLTLIQARLHTGRTHQIRCHFGALGHPLLGDRRYGDISGVPGLYLHAGILIFPRFFSEGMIMVKTDIPKEFLLLQENR